MTIAIAGLSIAESLFCNTRKGSIASPELVKAHQSLDRAVDVAYGKQTFKTEAERVAFLFERYQQFVAPLNLTVKSLKRRAKKTVLCAEMGTFDTNES